jgi:hypothetical protein
MRVIKFRAWDKEKAKMDKNFRFDEFNDVNDYFADDDFVFMQYTGLKDQNGKEIYEGDIILLPNGNLGEIFWGNFYAGFEISFNGAFPEELDVRLAGSSEIIGNIYENKELLNE